jgi:hypothetical protein
VRILRRVLFDTVLFFWTLKEPRLFSISSCFSGSNGRIFPEIKNSKTLVTNVIREEASS